MLQAVTKAERGEGRNEQNRRIADIFRWNTAAVCAMIRKMDPPDEEIREDARSGLRSDTSEQSCNRRFY